MSRAAKQDESAAQNGRTSDTNGRHQVATEAPELHDIRADRITDETPRFYSPGRLRWGTVAILQGAKGVGKSSILRAIAAEVTGGPKFLGTVKRRKPLGAVLWYSGEESLKFKVKPGLRAAGANLAYVHCSDLHSCDRGGTLALPQDRDRLEARIVERGAKLVVIDPLFAFADGSTDLEGPTLPARRFMSSLGRIAERTDALILLSRNLTKDTSHGALAAGRGSGELGNYARAVLHCDRMPGETDRFAMAVAAFNDGPEAATTSYTLAVVERGVRVALGKVLTLTADDLAGGEEQELDRSQLGRARALLRHMLAQGEVESKSVKSRALEECIPERTLIKALRAEAIEVRRTGSRSETQTYWSYPKLPKKG